jgi:hypothetical protein
MIAPIENRAEDIETFGGSEGQRVRFAAVAAIFFLRISSRSFGNEAVSDETAGYLTIPGRDQAWVSAGASPSG